MVGQLMWTGERRLRVRLREERVRGMVVLRAELPGREDQRGAERKRERGLQLLEEQGCRQLLEPEGGLPTVPTRGLWQSVAAELTLSFFQRWGQRPEKAMVALSGERITRPLFDTCCRLIPAVRGIALTPCPGSEELAWWLERHYGMPVSAGGGDVTVRFRPGEGERGASLDLGEERPAPEGFTLALREEGLPEDLPALPLMAAMQASGRLRPEEIRVVTVS